MPAIRAAFDQNLSFCAHVEKWTAKARAVANHLKRLRQHATWPITCRGENGCHGLRRAGLIIRHYSRVAGEDSPVMGESVGYTLQDTTPITQNDKRRKPIYEGYPPCVEDIANHTLYRESGIPLIDQLLEA